MPTNLSFKADVFTFFPSYESNWFLNSEAEKEIVSVPCSGSLDSMAQLKTAKIRMAEVM